MSHRLTLHPVGELAYGVTMYKVRAHAGSNRYEYE
jgi:hypothetical protein